MSIFSKPLSQLSTADLEELLQAGAVENVRLEFKSEVPGPDETLKKLSSLANTYGGFVVIGAAAGNDGRITGLPGVEVQPSYKQTIAQRCAAGISPFLQVDVSDPIPIAPESDRVCYVIGIAESELTPHFLNGRKGVWVRTNEFSSRFEARFANEIELRQLATRRQLVRERRNALVARARNRFEVFVSRRYTELNPDRAAIGARFTLCMTPRFPAAPLCDQSSLRTIVGNITLPWRGVGFPRRTAGILTQYESEIVFRPGSLFSILEANIWGLLFYASEIEGAEDSYSGIHLNRFVGQILVFLAHARRTIDALGYSGPLLMQMRLEGIRDVPWIYFPDRQNPEIGPASTLDDDVSFSISADVSDLRTRIDGVVRDIIRIVFFATAWPTLAESGERLAELIKSAYRFNSWDIPEALDL